jgi:hypothetical protein
MFRQKKTSTATATATGVSPDSFVVIFNLLAKARPALFFFKKSGQ